MVRDVLAYDGFISRLRTLCEDFYRTTAVTGGLLGSMSALKKRDKTFRIDQDREMRRLWRELWFPENTPPYIVSLFKEETLRRFGLDWWGDGKTNGYTDIVEGHRISDETRRIEQYGRSTEIRLVVNDRMITTGYSSWYWSALSSMMVGGSASASTIFVFRPAMVDGQYQMWWNATDAERRAEKKEQITRLRAEDDALAAKNPCAYLPGLSRALHYAATLRIYDRIAAEKLEGPDLCIAFVNELERVQYSYLVFAHEGRHLIDKRYFPGEFNAVELEWRAKLSEIAFAADSKLAFTNILTAYIGDPKMPHAVADERIVKAYVQWMAANVDKIPGLNRSRPLLPQFDLISDEQVKQVARSVDPLAEGK